ncbi:hypothetical protein [Actinomadura madurae]|uniref:hypothetical protein n=1 Tax=Actinomadura madurae TaxID=1993 RepID=UPI0020D2542B|nr:hypothetical protein [Actinomadura madurae]MCP9980214.1 hypothetical protein [Actinomadura madurae]
MTPSDSENRLPLSMMSVAATATGPMTATEATIALAFAQVAKPSVVTDAIASSPATASTAIRPRAEGFPAEPDLGTASAGAALTSSVIARPRSE